MKEIGYAFKVVIFDEGRWALDICIIVQDLRMNKVGEVAERALGIISDEYVIHRIEYIGPAFSDPK